ncbi:transcription initiation factor IIA, gamma subunit [Piedraia hortae CBS 480.64]|uniref:Transcription initiation factor IIA subunit 2 n=1 Tax=Piedraia hortae CBS 480.64 TaxID=1314780 RepID=A0A6A7C2I9_9PEZI|nr:transcription initiation factor IIA, gamma subunit [Piedraia hortae CBS 480.64]
MSAPAGNQSYYELYRGTSIGLALADALDEMITARQIEPQLAMRIMNNFDQCISAVLSEQVRAKMSFKGSLDTYRFCDEVWTFIINNAKFKMDGAGARADGSSNVEAARIKIVACQSKQQS